MAIQNSAPGTDRGASLEAQAGSRLRAPSHWTNLAPGLILMLACGSAAYWLSGLHASLDALAVAILAGIAARVAVGRSDPWQPGAALAAQVFIPAGIILYGTRLDFLRLGGLPGMTIFLTLIGMGTFYIVIFWLNGFWKVRPKTSELIASGSAVCGASAIAVLSPIADAEAEDTSVSLLVVTAIGLLGAMVYPLLHSWLSLTDLQYAVLSGATLHQTGIVKLAVNGLDPEIIDVAMAVKTTRIVMLVGISVVTGLLHGGFRESRSLLRALRRVWFLLPFVLMGLAVSYLPDAREFLLSLSSLGTLIFAIALASIGFSVDIESVLTVGYRPLLIGFLGWVCVVLIFLFLSPLFIG